MQKFSPRDFISKLPFYQAYPNCHAKRKKMKQKTTLESKQKNN